MTSSSLDTGFRHPFSNEPGKLAVPAAPDSGIIDLKAALGRMGNDRDLLKDMAEFFLADAPPLMAQIRQAHGARNAEELSRSAHSLKGLASNFSALKVQELAEEIEHLGRASRFDDAETRIDPLEREIHRVLSSLQRRVIGR